MSLLDHQKNRIYKLRGEGPWTIGRSHHNSIVVKGNEAVSRVHARIEVVNNVPYIIDQGTPKKVVLNGETVTQHALKPVDVINLAGYFYTLNVRDGATIFSQGSEPFSAILEEELNDRESTSSFDWSSSRTSTLSTGISEETRSDLRMSLLIE